MRAVFDRSTDSGYAERIQDRIASSLEPIYEQLFASCDRALHPGAAAQARAAVLVRVIAWWAHAPARASRREVVDVLLELDPVRSTGGVVPLAESNPTTPPDHDQEQPR